MNELPENLYVKGDQSTNLEVMVSVRDSNEQSSGVSDGMHLALILKKQGRPKHANYT